jgi:2-oxo-4-hydroxy-4-carboxy--5-ureidoimidazoline (OHCU) decarboxylase
MAKLPKLTEKEREAYKDLTVRFKDGYRIPYLTLWDMPREKHLEVYRDHNAMGAKVYKK